MFDDPLDRDFPRTIPVTIRGQTLAVWKGEPQELTPDVVKALGADEYLNLPMEETTRHFQGLVFVSYNANAMSNIPHVPWVCMTQAGFEVLSNRVDEIGYPGKPGEQMKVDRIH